MDIDEEPNHIEKKQDEEYKKLRQKGKDPLEAANEAVPPETTIMRTSANQEDSPVKQIKNTALDEEGGEE